MQKSNHFDNISQIHKRENMSAKAILSLSICALCLQANIKNGKTVYETNCANCHSTKMDGGMGKDFNLVSYTRTKDEIKGYALDPAGNFRKFGYSSNAMPKFNITEEEASDVAEFIDSLQPFKKWMKQ